MYAVEEASGSKVFTQPLLIRMRVIMRIFYDKDEASSLTVDPPGETTEYETMNTLLRHSLSD
ncbi:hypothetical protein [Halothiobacillus sp.]|uniref:hypothetical protein n=1 Tax=Halothiobacillus sp. TaxID=1891311 RepID=UPI0026183775|nr:hypothetical protein [Halothiobacillus sp.]